MKSGLPAKAAHVAITHPVRIVYFIIKKYLGLPTVE